MLEAKQGSERGEPRELPLFGGTALTLGKSRKGTALRGTRTWDAAMISARGQAERYAKSLPVEEGWPPFLVVVDVGHVIELFADFSRTGKNYTHFPDSASFRIALADLADETVRERLRYVWTEPQALDPTRRSSKVTRGIADSLAKLAKSLEAGGHNAKRVATFLMRCLFTMFAEDINLLPKGCFTELLKSLESDPKGFPPLVKRLWEEMNVGSGYSTVIRSKVLRFNGGLFKEVDALPLTEAQLSLLLDAAKADWRDVEPAIFGTLLERALDPRERHKLGAHYTPRAYVERLVLPTVIEPLRDDWTNVMGAAVQLATAGDTLGAISEVQTFHRRLCEVRVLDPACGSGNFLYVALEHMKRLEDEVLDVLAKMGETQYLLELDRHTITPAQFLGIEINPRAAAIADLVLWIGYLQRHVRTKGGATPAEPVLRDYRNIQNRDAILDWDRTEIVRDEHDRAVTRWDGRTTKRNPVTCAEVPDDEAQVEMVKYIGARPAKWPKATFVIGNPPFIGTKRMRAALGDGYVDAVRNTISEVPESADLVMYWWHQAAELLTARKIRRFGFITTNSISMAFNRRVVQPWLTRTKPISLAFAIPDHPWTDLTDGANVRIAMTVAEFGTRDGRLLNIREEHDCGGDEMEVAFAEQCGRIAADLSVGTDVTLAVPLAANSGVSGMGSAMHGAGFILSPERAAALKAHGAQVIRPYIGGRDLLRGAHPRYVIDFSGLTEDQARQANPAAFQHVIDHVKPERDQNRRPSIRNLWWRFGWERPLLRRALAGVHRYIATTETAKHRVFQFVSADVLPDHMVVTMALSDAFALGILSSAPHLIWAYAAGGTLEDRPRYNKSVCFDPFPFPTPPEDLTAQIRALGEELDTFRKERQAENPNLTLTGMYNVLEKIRAAASLSSKDRLIHEAGLVSILRDIHDRLDAAVFEAYGWPPTLTKDGILAHLVALNSERAADEKRGAVRWLRPDFQAPELAAAVQQEMDGLSTVAVAVVKGVKPGWPKTLPEQVQAIREALSGLAAPTDARAIARLFKGARSDRVEEILRTLVTMGQARVADAGKYAA
ncbi:MAG: class I SAM-dependent DNA methyltransferase [Alphaproteobacteria bacterium]|nr:class I SAM-dependent DNA methyltransferase [Alphaproteobacteria bacterium]